MNHSVSLLLFVFAVVPQPMAADATQSFRSGSQQKPLVELFTSEGCSSCPPAEQWLGEFAGRPELWRDFVPVVWHVDYWDGLGWPDRFASQANTKRQENYSASWRTGSIYTPGFVLNGAEWRGWNRPIDFSKATSIDAGILDVTGTGTNQFTVTFAPESERGGGLDVTLAWLGSDLVSDVRRGENAGRKLKHNFVVLRTVVTKLKADHGKYSASVSLPRIDELDSRRMALAAWISRTGEQAPIQAAGGWWKP